MAISISLYISRFTPLIYLYLLFIPLISAVNITHILSPFPDLSDFSDLLSTTAVAADLLHRTSVTILAVPNSFLRSSDLIRRSSSTTNLADVIRHHILLQYLTLHDLRRFPPSGKLIATLFQSASAGAGDIIGSVNITHDTYSNSTTIQSLTNNTTTTVISQIVTLTLPYNLTILTVDSFIIPIGFDLTASIENQPPLNLNITKTLIDGHNFNVAASILSASGVFHEFESEKGGPGAGAGITMFVPTDDAFSNIPVTENFQSLPADKKADVLRFHVLLSYYPLGSLESIVNPFQPTLATEDKGAGRFTLNISRVNGSVAISSGLVEASVTQTVFDQNPIAIFGISRVLLPKEIFGKKDVVENGELPTEVMSPPPVNYSPALNGPSSSPGVREEMHSAAATVQDLNLGLYLYTGLYLLYVLS